MQSNVSSAAVARPHAHRAMSSSAAFSPLLHRQVFDGQASNFIRQPPSIREGNYPEAIGSARLQGQVVSPPPSGSSYGNHVDPASKERSRERDEKQKLRHTLSGSTSKELPAPTLESPALDRFRGHFELGSASVTPAENTTSPFARSGLGFGGQLANSGGRPSFGFTSSASATASTFSNLGHFDSEGQRLHEGDPVGSRDGFLIAPTRNVTRSNSYTPGDKKSPLVSDCYLGKLPGIVPFYLHWWCVLLTHVLFASPGHQACLL